jgi:uncharacterized membrane protein
MQLKSNGDQYVCMQQLSIPTFSKQQPVIFLGLLLLATVSVNAQQFTNLPEKLSTNDIVDVGISNLVEKEADKLRQFLLSATEDQLKSILGQPFPNEYDLEWASFLFGGTPSNEVNALRRGWLESARGDDLLSTASRPRMHLTYHKYLSAWRLLLKKDPNAGLAWVSQMKNELPPTLLHAVVTGWLFEMERGFAHGKKYPIDVNVFTTQHSGFWHSMLSAKNPIFLATVLQTAKKFETGVPLTEAIGRGLQSEWVSLQFIALETAESIKPPGVKKVIEEYEKMKRTGMTDEVAKQLNEKTQSVLKSLEGQN